MAAYLVLRMEGGGEAVSLCLCVCMCVPVCVCSQGDMSLEATKQIRDT